MSTKLERINKSKTYLTTKVDRYMNKLVVDLLKSKPDDVLIYMRDWCNSQIDMREQGQVSESDAMLKTATQRDP